MLFRSPGLWNASVLLGESGSRFSEFKSRVEQEYGGPMDFGQLVFFCLNSPGRDPVFDQGKYLMLETAMRVRDGITLLENEALKSGAVLSVKNEMVLTGGQAENALWNQVKADVTACTLYTQPLVHAELTGDAVFALVALGIYKDIPSAAMAVCKRENQYEPRGM